VVKSKEPGNQNQQKLFRLMLRRECIVKEQENVGEATLPAQKLSPILAIIAGFFAFRATRGSTF
jgi:hypothetical protein